MPFTLLLLRHAETEPKQPDQSDFDRRLLPKGILQATLLGQQLTDQTLKLDKVISSPALRARQTCTTILQPLKTDSNDIQFESAIYSGDIEDLLEILRQTKDNDSILLMIGHNPTLSSLVNYLDKDFRQSLNTCDLAWIELDITDWSSIDQHCGFVKTLIQSSSLLENG
jgi:phosphohistidine phosphatase